MVNELDTRIRNVTAVLGPTNTGKTHLAIERMLGHESGMIGLPLRLLAREVYDKIAAKVGVANVALITGEEKIKPESARYWVCTVEAMPRDVTVDFLAIDEIQLAADPERGHVFTDRLLHARGRSETMLLGASTMRDAIADIVPNANFISRPRLSKLTYAGQKKLTRLPKRSAIVAFSAAEVYAIAELIRRQQGGAAVVIGALSPRTRNAQVALYQSGDVEYLVATDAIGMGLNLDLDHVALSALRKFDGQNHRNLTPSEIAQIAGRAGRHMNDGTFGVTGGADPLDAELIERLENHNFEPVRTLQWRNRAIDFSTLYALRESLRDIPKLPRLARARMADDVAALETVSSEADVAQLAANPAAVELLWDVCQIPDYRKISASNHAELVSTLYKQLRSGDERIPEDWFSKQVAFADRTDGDIDTLSNRLAHVRTWTFVSNRANWLKDPAHWQAKTREIEDKLSDALHERLTERFVDRRTSALMKGMRDKDELSAEIAEDGAIHVETHYVGRLKGFRFIADAPSSEGVNQKAARAAASQVVSREMGMRARRVTAAKADAFKLTRKGTLLWRGEDLAEVTASDDPLKPNISLLVDDTISAPDREKLQARLETWITEMVADKLKPLAEIANAEDVTGMAKGIAFRLRENIGILKRESVASEIKSLDQPARSQLRKYGVRFGAFNVFFPLLLKPAPADLALSLWCIKYASANGLSRDALPEPPRPGLTSVATDPAISETYYRACGYHLCGPRAVRLDILERLADLIRPLLAFRQSKDSAAPPLVAPRGSTGDGGFTVLPEMMSILGCSPDELSNVLKALGFWSEKRPVKVAVVAPVVAEAAPAVVEAAVEAAVPATEAASAEPPAADSAEAAPSVEPIAPPLPAAHVAADAPSEPASTETPAAETAAPPEPQMEDVWRPRRPHQRGQGERAARGDGARNRDRSGASRNQGRGQRAPGQIGTEGAQGQSGGEATPNQVGAGDAQKTSQSRESRGNRDRSRYRKPDTVADPAVTAATPGEGNPATPDEGVQNRQRGNTRAGDQTPRRRDEHTSNTASRPQENRGANAPSHGNRDDRNRGRSNDRPRRDGDNSGNRGPRVITASPSKPSAGNDSPFAALSALREQLAKGGKEKNQP